MIRIGLAGWGDHDSLYEKGTAPRDRLKVYGGHFPVVEVDSSFYAVQPQRNMARWAEITPPDFAFVIKAYQGMTGHLRGKNPFADTETMFEAFRTSIGPVREAGKLKAVLFQFPPWFDCKREHVEELRQTRERMGELPVALEFRHRSWFEGAMRDKTLAFMRREGWIHSICDEPQAGVGSIPAVLEPTDPKVTIVRMHGRNAAHWNGGGGPNWREVRYLYDYSREELQEWERNLRQLEQASEEVCVIFNNNSGGHAAGNARELMGLLGQEARALAPQQLDLF